MMFNNEHNVQTFDLQDILGINCLIFKYIAF